MPKLGNVPVDRLTQQDILAVLTPIWHTTPETARRVRQPIRTVLKHCQFHGYVTDNVAGESIDGALPSMPKVKENFRSLDYRKMPEAVRLIETKVSSMTSRLCMLFLIYTATRSNEVWEAKHGRRKILRPLHGLYRAIE